MIDAKDLSKRYDEVVGLERFSLTVEPGEIMGLVGPNGAGKTTLIKILATLLRPDAGTAAVAGHDVRGQPREVRRRVGYLPDVPGLYQDMRVGEFLEFYADAYHLRGPERRSAVDEALQRSALVDRRQQFVEQLSLGLKQRLLIGKTLLHAPSVLLLDEPATGLDPLARIELRDLLRDVSASGVTVLISSHILSDLEDVCARVALIAEGRNAPGPDGRSVLVLGGDAARAYEVDVLGDTHAATEVLRAFVGARLLEAEGSRLRIDIRGGEVRAAALLQNLVQSGVSVVRFDSAARGLEGRYRQVFQRGPR